VNNKRINTELVLQLYEAFSNRDYKALENICSGDIKWVQNPGFPMGGTNVGIDNIIKNVYEANSKNWKYFDFERKIISELDDTVLVEGLYKVQGTKSQEIASVQTAHVFRIKNNKVISFQQYTDSKILWDNYNNKELI